MTTAAENDNNHDETGGRRRVVIVTGMSGAGMSTALKALEDLGYEAVDNLRLGLIGALVKQTARSHMPLAVGVDTRNPDFSVAALLTGYQQLQADGALDAKLVFLECSDEALQQRFTETRRRHPLAIDRPVSDGIRQEREMLWQVRDEADHVLDTSLLSIHELRRLIVGHYRLDAASGLSLFITSFAYRRGLPREADLVFDVRFLNNPHWQPHLRQMTGLDADVAEYIAQDPDYAKFLSGLGDWLITLLPRYAQEGKSYLTLAVGCTGGRHRSVLVAEQLGTIIAAQGYIVGIGHRDLDRRGKD
ncbi:MAG: RNase adapter RapZ [Alphaproteobacteria bacterium]|nr:RNase adapter RapZ [Alphaproteobacteria bacterium]